MKIRDIQNNLETLFDRAQNARTDDQGEQAAILAQLIECTQAIAAKLLDTKPQD